MELKKAPPPVSEINVTPMVDVMLVVLIIFMVITPMRSTTVPVAKYRARNAVGMPDADKEGLNERKAIALMLAQPSMIKRPVLEAGSKLLVGFKPEIYAREVTPTGRARKG